MISALPRLFGQLRNFVELELRGVSTWDQVKPLASVEHERVEYGRRNPLGKYKEIAGVALGDYELTIKAPEEAPPLGEIELRRGDLVETGPIDQRTWARFGTIIRNEVQDHGRRAS